MITLKTLTDMKTMKEVSKSMQERATAIRQEKIKGWNYCIYDTGMIVDNQSVTVIAFEHENGFVEIACNMFWSEPVEVYSDGRISWGSGPSTVAGNSNEIARVMSYIFEIISENYTK